MFPFFIIPIFLSVPGFFLIISNLSLYLKPVSITISDKDPSIECTFCKNIIYIKPKKSNQEIKCSKCKKVIKVNYSNNDFTQEGYKPEIIVCPNCTRDIYVNHSIRPFKLRCPECKIVLNIDRIKKGDNKNIYINCPKCKKSIKYDSIMKGKKIKCSNCGQKIKIN